MIALTLPDQIRLYNVADFQPRRCPPFPLEEDESAILSRLNLDEDDGDDGEHVDVPIVLQRTTLSPPLVGQDIFIPSAEDKLQAVSLGCHGLSLMALGGKGRIWIWTSAVE